MELLFLQQLEQVRQSLYSRWIWKIQPYFQSPWWSAARDLHCSLRVQFWNMLVLKILFRNSILQQLSALSICSVSFVVFMECEQSIYLGLQNDFLLQPRHQWSHVWRSFVLHHKDTHLSWFHLFWKYHPLLWPFRMFSASKVITALQKSVLLDIFSLLCCQQTQL